MLGLKLREKFRGRLLKGTAIELANDSQTGATQLTSVRNGSDDADQPVHRVHPVAIDFMAGGRPAGLYHGRIT